MRQKPARLALAGYGLGLILVCLGVATPVTAQSPRVVSLVPALTETLVAMGEGSTLVAVSTFDTFPPEIARLPKVGALLDPDVERILSLKPTLVLCAASQTDLQTKLHRAGIRTFHYSHGSLTDILATTQQLGDAVGASQAGRALVQRMAQQLDAVRRAVAGRPAPRVMLVVDREAGSLRAVRVNGGFGFLHDLIELAGGHNVFSDIRQGSAIVTTETILTRAPDVIVELRYTPTADAATYERIRRDWDTLPGVPAVKHQRVYALFGSELVIPGPRVARIAERFADVFSRGAARRP